MNDAQLRLYRFESSAWRKARKALGRPASEEDRHALHIKVLGRDKSSLELTNAEFDLILAAFRAESRPDDLNAQLRQLDQPGQRHSALMARARDLTAKAGIKLGSEGSYLDGMARKIFRIDQYHELNEKQLGQLCGILQRRIEQVARKNGLQPVGKPVDRSDPF